MASDMMSYQHAVQLFQSLHRFFFFFFFNWWNSKMFRMNGLLRERVTARTSCTSRPVILMLLNRREACNTSCSCAAQELHVHCELHFPDNFAICDACVNTHTHTPSQSASTTGASARRHANKATGYNGGWWLKTGCTYCTGEKYSHF